MTSTALGSRTTERRRERASPDAAVESPQRGRRGAHADILLLQRTAGNRAVAGLLQCDAPPRPGPLLQRKCASCAAGGPTCSHCEEEEQKHLQRKPARTGGGALSSTVHEAIQRTGRPLDATTAGWMGRRFGRDFSDVEIHDSAPAAESARRVNALAYTVGRHIVFGQGRYDPRGADGQRLLAHELTHVVQQTSGRVRDDRAAADDVSLAEHPVFEREADRTARALVDEGLTSPRGLSEAPTGLARKDGGNRPSGPATGPVQLVEISCADNTITFQSAGGARQYALTSCDVTDGEYTAGVTVRGSDVRFNLGSQAAEGRRFLFNYRVDPGQPNPATLFRNQSSVRIVARAGPLSGEGRTRFNVQVLSAAEFLALTGVDSGRLSEGRYIPGDTLGARTSTGGPERTWVDPLATSTLIPSVTSPLPSVIPRNATGVMWTQVGHGHLSEFANVGGGTTARGFRGTLVRHGWGSRFPQTLEPGIPGGFRNDFLFTFFPEQTVVYRPVDAAAAEAFREKLRTTEFSETYRLPPRAGVATACQGTNCITVPAEVITEALGGRPEILTPEGPIDITQMGRPSPGAPFEPGQAGRGATVREWLNQPEEAFLERGLTRVRVPGYTPTARVGVGFVKAGGVIFMVYGAYRTYERIEAAAGTPELPKVVAEETGSWTGGLIGSALGTALAAGVVCSPSGPVTFVCVAGGFLGGLLFGYAGSTVGAAAGRGLFESEGGECPSCHAEQRKWARQREWQLPGFPESGSLPSPRRPGSGNRISDEDARRIQEWMRQTQQ